MGQVYCSSFLKWKWFLIDLFEIKEKLYLLHICDRGKVNWCLDILRTYILKGGLDEVDYGAYITKLKVSLEQNLSCYSNKKNLNEAECILEVEYLISLLLIIFDNYGRSF